MLTAAVLGETSMVEVAAVHHPPVPHRDPEMEAFETPEIIFTLTDRWMIRSGGREEEVHPGRVVLGNRGQTYRCRHFDEIPGDRNIAIAFRGAPGGLEELTGRAGPLFGALSIPLTPGLRAALASLLRESRERRPGHLLLIESLSMAILVEAVRTAGGESGREPPRSLTAEAVEHARRFIESHFAEELDLSTIAGAAGLSPFHFSRLFRLQTGRSPYQYLLQTRLEQAAFLLRESSLSVTEVAMQVGLSDPAHFARLFRRRTGQAPAAFRRAHRS